MIGGANIGGHDERYRATLGDRPYPTEWMGGGRDRFHVYYISYHIIYNCRGYLQHVAQSIFHLFNGGVYGHDPGRSIRLGWQQNWFRFERLDREKKSRKTCHSFPIIDMEVGHAPPRVRDQRWRRHFFTVDGRDALGCCLSQIIRRETRPTNSVNSGSRKEGPACADWKVLYTYRQK
jgi:hypothetical protein